MYHHTLLHPKGGKKMMRNIHNCKLSIKLVSYLPIFSYINYIDKMIKQGEDMVKRSFKIVSSLFLGAAFMVSNCRVFTVEAREAVEKRYLGGNDRYETAVRVSEEGWNYSDNVVLVNGTAIAVPLTKTTLSE